MQEVTASSFQMAWKCNFAAMGTAADMPAAEIKDISIIFNLQHRGGTIITSNWDPVPLASYLLGNATPAEPKALEKVGDPVKDEAYEAILQQMPWLQHLDAVDSFVANAEKKKMASKASGSVDKMEEEFTVNEEEILDALAKVDKARMLEGGVAAEASTSDFVAKECHGESNLKKGKEYHDAVQGHPAHEAADDWARKRKLQTTYKMTFSLHTEGPSRIVVRAWVHKMQWMYDKAMAAEGADFAFTEAVMAEYNEPAELARLATDPTTKADTTTRICKLRAMVPK